MPTPGEHSAVPKVRKVGLLKPLYFPIQDTRARTNYIPVSRATLTHGFLTFIHSFPPPFSPFSRVLLPAFRLLLRARLFTCRRAFAEREVVHVLAGQCGNHMGTAIKKVLSDESGFGGDGECSGDNDAQLDLINVFYHWASGGMYVPRSDLFNLKPGVIGSSGISLRIHSLVKKTLHRHRAGFEPQRASSFMKRVKASQILGEAVRA